MNVFIENGRYSSIVKKLCYAIRHFPLGIHLLLHTRVWGVNNRWKDYSIRNSIFGQNLFKQVVGILLIYPIVVNYRHLKWRMGSSVGFVSQKEFHLFFNQKTIGRN